MDRLFSRPLVYSRPKSRSSKLLPPLPSGMERIYVDQDTARALSSLPSYRLPAFTLVVSAFGLIVCLISLVPLLILSPALLILNVVDFLLPNAKDFVREIVVAMHPVWLVLVTICAVLITLKNSTIESYLFRAALEEEQWFRSGSERWTTSQKLTSNIVFGWVHIYNLIYPLAAFFGICLVGGALMYTYQREFNRSRSVRMATLASTKMHTKANLYILRLIMVALLVLVYAPIVCMKGY